MPYLTLAGVKFVLKNETLLPANFLASLRVFQVDTAPGSQPITIEVVKAAPPNGEAVFCSTSMRVSSVGNANSSGRLFVVPQDKSCALLADGNAWTVYVDGETDATDSLRVLFRMAFEQHVASLGVLSLHACAFVYGGKAYCTTGKSGAGKSTLAGNVRKAFEGVWMLNGDRPIVREENGTFIAYGAPWSGKENIFINDSRPLGAVIEVKKCGVDKLYRLPPKRAAKLLMKRVSLPLWDSGAVGDVIATISRAAERVPVFRMYCKNDVSAGETLLAALEHPEQVILLPEGEDTMKIKKNFVMRKMLDEYIVVPVGADSAAAQGAIMLNEVGAFLWEKMTEETTRELLLEQLLAEFEVEKEVASADLDEFLQTLRDANVLE